MKIISFNADWESVTTQKDFPFGTVRTPVMLPYDDLLNEARTPDAPGGAGSGFYPEHISAMEKKFMVPAEWADQRVIFEFEGVYSHSQVYLNREYAGGCSHGYTNFLIDADGFLKYGEMNEIKVISRSSVDSRWYSGCGIYRSVNLLLGSGCYITPYGHRITAAEADEEGALLIVSTTLETIRRQPQCLTIATQILDADGTAVSEGRDPVTVFPGEGETVVQRLYVKAPHRWSPEEPYLYDVRTCVTADGAETDCAETPFGIRTLSLDAQHGLRINGQSVKLRGACVHHDNGLLGAADIYRAEERRVQLLKNAGFNAVRSAHNQISRAFLEACDREGVLVMDELTDMWTQPKTDFDYSDSFAEHWETLTEAMVNKDFNHPSVILYSFGNEIPEIGNAHGTRLGRRIARKLHALDPTRYTINSMNLLMAAMGRFTASELIAEANKDINEMMNSLGDRLNALANSDFVTGIVRESLSVPDVTGYNYATGRYRDDRIRLPGRVLCGSETYPRQIAENWAVIQECPHVIGDFTWTGWDYLGEAGIGQIRYQEDGANASYGTYPCFIAYCGDLDITGRRRPVSYFREIVFGLRREPYMAVMYPCHYGKTAIPNNWAFFDGIDSWTWPGCEGALTKVQVYADADTAELYLNGDKIADASVRDYIAEFTVTYRPGKLTAVVYQDGNESGRTQLQTASDALQLRVSADRTVLENSDRDLSYLEIALTDETGIVQNMADRRINVKAEGAGFLAGLGSADPEGTDSFRSDTAATFDGRAQAIIRPSGTGDITVTVEAEGVMPQRIHLQVK